MHKIIPPLIGLTVSMFFVYRAATNMPNVLEDAKTPSKLSAKSREVAAASGDQRATEPVHKSVVRFLRDMDDLLDTIHDPASFAAARPKLLNRARQQAALAAQHPNQGMTRLSRSAAPEWQDAANRHSESLARAIEAVPAVRELFERDLAAIMNGE